MGIYDENKFSFPTVRVSFKQFKYPILAVIALIVVIAVLFSLNEALKPKPLQLSLSPNPLDLTKGSESSAMLKVQVFNTENMAVSSVIVKVEETGSSALIIFPSQRRIDSMAPGTDRQLDSFVLRPNPNKEIQSGSYKIRVSLLVEGQEKAAEELTLVIKAV